MNNKQKNILKKIKDEAIRLDWEQAFGGKSYGNHHLERVNKIAQFLVKKEGGDEFITLAGAWVHDVSLVAGDDSDPQKVLLFTKKFLAKFPELTSEEIGKIAEAVSFHEKGGKGLSLEGRIVHDADVVDKSGILGVIRHIWKMTNMLEDRVLEGKNDLEVLKNHLRSREANIFTDSAKSLITKLNQSREEFFEDENSLSLLNSISRKARNGDTSDKIAEDILNQSSKSAFSKVLLDQLSCKYLL